MSAHSSLPERDLLICAVETNDHHGIGIQLRRFFPDSREFVCLRTTSLYGGQETFGAHHHELCSRYLQPAEVEIHLRAILALYRIRRILCIPYYREEFVHGVLAKRLTSAPLCTYIMDDQNVHAPHVPDRWVAQLLACSDLCLGISAELCAAYRQKFGHRFHLLPPVVPALGPILPNYWRAEAGEPLRAAMIGNVWTAQRLTQLRALLRETGLGLDWYGNGPHASWLTGSPAEWEPDGIRCLGFLSEADLVAALASYPFVVIPSGDLDGTDDNPAFSHLSLPSRLVFLHARTDTPVLVLGSPETAAGRFVTRHGTGLCALHHTAAVQSAITVLAEPAHRTTYRSRIREAAPALHLANPGDWIWQSLAACAPQPAPFHRLFPAGYAPAPLLPPTRMADPPPPPPRPFRIEHAAGYAYARRSAAAYALGPGVDPARLDQWEVLQALTAHLLRGLDPAGDGLFLGPELPPIVRLAAPRLRWWTIRDLAHWRRTGYSGDPAHLAPADSERAPLAGFPQFAAIASSDWCGKIPDNPHELEGLALYLDSCTQPGGVNIHSFTTVLSPSFFWAGPAYGHLRRRFLSTTPWPGLDAVLCDPDVFFLDESVYARDWQPQTKKTYAEFGRLLYQTLCWARPY
jgi:hypothetical protein